MVDDLAVDLLGHPLVEAAVARLHVKDRDLPPLGRDGGQAGISVAQDQHGVGPDFTEDRSTLAMTWPMVSAAVAPAAPRKWSGVRISEVVEEDLVQLVVVVLPGVDDDVVDVAVERGHHARQADDLGPGADNGGDFHAAAQPCSTSR